MHGKSTLYLFFFAFKHTHFHDITVLVREVMRIPISALFANPLYIGNSFQLNQLGKCAGEKPAYAITTTHDALEFRKN